MAPSGRVQQACLSRVNTLQELGWLTLFLEVDQVFVIVEDLDVRESSPSVLNFLNSYRFLRLLIDLLFALLTATPCPLDLDCCNVVHRKPMVLEEASCEGHFISGLNESRCKVLHTLLLVARHDVERRCEELLTQALCR